MRRQKMEWINPIIRDKFAHNHKKVEIEFFLFDPRDTSVEVICSNTMFGWSQSRNINNKAIGKKRLKILSACKLAYDLAPKAEGVNP